MPGGAVESERFEVTGNGGATLQALASIPAAPKAVVALTHGYAEHTGRYRHVIDALNQSDYTVFAVDHRGHGACTGRRATIRRFDEFVDDFHLLVERARSRFSTIPRFVLAHSMGGLIAIRYALRHQHELAGLVLSGPALIVGESVPTWQTRLLLYLSRLAPDLPLLPATPGLLSRDPEVERRMLADPLCYHGRIRLGLARELYLAAEETRNHLAAITLPFLVMHGAVDRVTSPRGSELLYDQAKSTDKTIKLWPDDRHEIFNELDADAVIATMRDWMDPE
ncbi:MAG TPA: lysophospholipase [Thermomicrobiales bacterium]|nr:lysophospholipase [Thermomicrobiales bacterium]